MLDWGTVPVLCYEEKQVTVTNQSQIEANFSAFMVITAIDVFSVVIKVEVKSRVRLLRTSEALRCEKITQLI